MATVEQRVEAGIAWIEANIPGGLERINTRTLNTVGIWTCPLAQALGKNYWYAVELCGLSRVRSIALGFMRDDDNPDETFVDLTEAWRRKLRERLIERVQALRWERVLASV